MAMNRAALLGLVVMLPVIASAQQSNPASSFTPAQRAAIIAIMREALRTDPSILREAIAALRRDQQNEDAADNSHAIAANHAAIFDAPGDPVIGNPRGAITLVEFFDVRCPYCRRMRPSIDTLLEHNRDVRIVMKDLPILGPASVLGSKALLAAQAQGGYAAMQTALMQEGVAVDLPTIERDAKAAGLNWPAMQKAMASPTLQVRLDANLQLATLLGINGTPAVIFGTHLADGALSLDDLTQVVSALRRG